ncbi:MAG: ComF family protein, partial [Chloroflexi bacterium]|nr:ComF family protein [Chloroflexota bacterium]
GCGRRDAVLCIECRPTIPWLPAAVCPRCARRTVDGRLCERCARQGSPALASVRAACAYGGPVRTALQRLKFRYVRALAPFAAELVCEALQARPVQVDLLVPVPLHPSRRRWRGFNQSELIARELGERLGVEVVPGALARVRDTPPQVGRSAAERRRSIDGAIACPDPSLVAGKRLALVDDVTTTGSTLEACARPLVAAGAAYVTALVVAKEL